MGFVGIKAVPEPEKFRKVLSVLRLCVERIRAAEGNHGWLHPIKYVLRWPTLYYSLKDAWLPCPPSQQSCEKKKANDMAGLDEANHERRSLRVIRPLHKTRFNIVYNSPFNWHRLAM